MSEDGDPTEAASGCCSQWTLVAFVFVVTVLALMAAYIESLGL